MTAFVAFVASHFLAVDGGLGCLLISHLA